jgi:hypothetical protein
MHPADLLFIDAASNLLWAGQLKGLPPELSLFVEDRQCPERVPAMQGYRMVENVQNAKTHAATPMRSDFSPSAARFRKKASNMSNVQIEAL